MDTVDTLVQVFREVLKYLKDMDKVNVLSTCKALRALVPYAPLRGVYAYEHTLNTPYTFINVEYTLISEVKPSDEFDVDLPELPPIPDVVTRLCIMNFDQFSLLNLSPKITHVLVYDDNYWEGYLIPKTVTHVTLVTGNDYMFGALHGSVTHLTVTCHPVRLDHIPKSVTHLCIDSFHKIRISPTIPHGVTHFTYGLSYIGCGADLPESCTHLKIYANLPYDLWLPDVMHIRFKGKFNRSIERWEMPSLTHLSFHKYYKHPIQGLIPPAVTYLRYCGNVYRGPEIDQFR